MFWVDQNNDRSSYDGTWRLVGRSKHLLTALLVIGLTSIRETISWRTSPVINSCQVPFAFKFCFQEQSQRLHVVL